MPITQPHRALPKPSRAAQAPNQREGTDEGGKYFLLGGPGAGKQERAERERSPVHPGLRRREAKMDDLGVQRGAAAVPRK